jgi:hypothetical protein
MKYLQKKGESLSTFAKAARTSRMQLYRIMAGEGTTTSRLKQISEATGGELSVADLVSHEPSSNGGDEQERSQESAA